MVSMTARLLKRITRARNTGSRRSGKPGARRRQIGFVMIEAVVALAILGTATAAMLSSLSTGARLSNRTSLNGTADWIATSQSNFIYDAPFVLTPGVYAPVNAPDNYTVSNQTSDVDGGNSEIQNITITITFQGQVLLTTEIIKVNR